MPSLAEKLRARKEATDKATGANKGKLKTCPPGHKLVKGKCVQKGVGPEYKP